MEPAASVDKGAPGDQKAAMSLSEIARQNRMPYIQFVESAGGDLRGDDDPERQMREQSDHFGESGRLFYDVTELSKLGIPSISVVFGSSTAGGSMRNTAALHPDLTFRSGTETGGDLAAADRGRKGCRWQPRSADRRCAQRLL